MRRTTFAMTIATVLALLLVSAGAPGPVLAATFAVDSANDEPDTNPGDGFCLSTITNRCTLRAAIMEANARAGADTITLPNGTFGLTISGLDDAAARGDLDITSDLTINGNGPNKTVIDASSIFPQRDRVFDVRPGGTLRLNGLRITGGRPQNTGDARDGGGIRVFDSGLLYLTTVLVDGNEAASVGGGIAVRASGYVLLMDTTVNNNHSLSNGGGLAVFDGSLNLIHSTVSRNASDHSGGGVYYMGSWIIAENSTISTNTAADTGGGLFLDLRNRPANPNRGNYIGLHLTVANNTTSSSGSGTNIYVNSPPGAPPYDLRKSIVAGGRQGKNCAGQPLASGGFNLEDQNFCGFTAAGDLPNTNPMLGALRTDNSLTEVHPLPYNSPAVDVIADCNGPRDQRGVSRPQDGNGDGVARCDIGAYELVRQ